MPSPRYMPPYKPLHGPELLSVERTCPKCGAVVVTHHRKMMALRAAANVYMPCCRTSIAVPMPASSADVIADYWKSIAEIDARIQKPLNRVMVLRAERAQLVRLVSRPFLEYDTAKEPA